MTAALSPARTVRRVEHVMGMPISVALRGRHADDGRGADAWAAALAVLREADRVFSTYRPESAVSPAGPRRAGPGGVPTRDGGGPRPRRGRAPGLRRRVRRLPAGGVLDPSGVVKGWAAERAATRLAALPDTDYCLSAGGDIACRTLDPDAPPWRIGIEDPHDPTRLVAVVPVRTGAVATSGTARRGAHIVDARSGNPPNGLASVTVVGRSLTAVDIDATAAFALGADAARWLAGRGHHAALLVRGDGSTLTV